MGDMNLFQKLVEIRKSVSFLKKEAQGDGVRFKFTPSSQVLMSIRDKMNELNVLLVPRVTGKEVRDHTTQRGAHWYFTELIMEFEWINADNPEDRFSVPWYGQGLDDGEKGVGKALTYAEKYLILKQFNIPTDKDDPDGLKPPASDTGKNGQKENAKISEKDAKQSAGKMKNTLSKVDSNEGCSKWWKENAGQIAKFPKQIADDITKAFTDHRGTFFIDCLKGNPDKPEKVLKTTCEGCDSRHGCPSWND